jgi:uncharacterized protein YhfF/GNAT superfamily N-acetyltransferase
MPIPDDIAEFWGRFSAAAGGVDSARFYEAFHFGDGEELANSLAALVLAGKKRATAGSLWSFEAEGKRMPRPGDLSVVTDFSGTPLCVIETSRVDVVPFDEVGAEFAGVEGEGDGSLAYWRRGHTAFFARECARHGRRFTPDMPVVCERFDVVFQDALRAGQPSLLAYRAARPHDAAACVDLRGKTRENAVSAQRLSTAGITVESWSDSIRSGALLGYVCLSEGKMIGYCFGAKASGEVVVLALLPEFERQGIGRALLNQVVEGLRSIGFARLFLGCSRDPSTRSHGFYRHLGWRTTGTFDSAGDEVLEYVLEDQATRTVRG